MRNCPDIAILFSHGVGITNLVMGSIMVSVIKLVMGLAMGSVLVSVIKSVMWFVMRSVMGSVSTCQKVLTYKLREDFKNLFLRNPSVNGVWGWCPPHS